MSDSTILLHIHDLVDEERRLRNASATPEQNSARLRQVADQLDRCSELLRWRGALREFDADPDDAAHFESTNCDTAFGELRA